MGSINSTCILDDAPLLFETINDFGELASTGKHKNFRKYSVYGVTCIMYYDAYSTPGNTKEVADSSIFTWCSKTPQCDCNTMLETDGSSHFCVLPFNMWSQLCTDKEEGIFADSKISEPV